MINTQDVLETINMIREENLDVRTITMGISLFDCVSEDENRLCDKITSAEIHNDIMGSDHCPVKLEIEL